MIYNKDRKLMYPTRKLINDAVYHPVPDDDAYSNLGSEVYEVVERRVSKVEDFWHLVRRDHFLEDINSSDVDTSKWYTDKAVGEGVDYSHDDALYLRSKSIVDKVKKYVDDSLYGFLYSRDDSISRKRKSKAVSGYILSNSNDVEQWVHGAEIEVDSEEEDSMLSESVVRGQVSKLIYYLKLMSELSIIKGFNIIQLIVLDARYGSASAITKCGIECVNGLGVVVGARAESFNSTQQWNELWMWFKNSNKDIWNIRVDKFLSIVAELGINIAKEDYSIYTVDYINSKMTSYIQSNEELIEEGLCGDRDLLTLLSPEYVISGKTTNVESSIEGHSVLSKLVAIYEELKEETLFNLSLAADNVTKAGREEYELLKSKAKLYQSDTNAVIDFLKWLYQDLRQPHERVCNGREGQDGFWMIMSKPDKYGESEEIYARIPKNVFTKLLSIPDGVDVYILGSGYTIWDNVGGDFSVYVCPLSTLRDSIQRRRFPVGEIKSLRS